MKWLMPVEEILRMQSNDALAWDAERYDLHGSTVADELTVKDIDDPYHQRILEVMAKEQINRIPVLIINDQLFNGHRRVKMAVELGLEEIQVTDRWEDSGWWDEDTVYGEEEAA